ncbi:MAG: hypothetical protein AMJ43_04630 [Coxiella sp. DG_40]|nr:MAG: hypothetical protein AMJ43_04630 [Coxiella sp. DG_40]
MKLKYFVIYPSSQKTTCLRVVIYSLILLICLISSGCIREQYIQRNEYMLDVKMPSKSKSSASNKVLEINNVTIAPQFSNLSFVYRISDINYIRDYYHIFFNPPEQQIEQLVVKYLQIKNLFKYIITDTNILQPDYILRYEITALYADYRDFKRPKAVAIIHFTLFDSKTSRILMNRKFSAVIPLRKKDTQNLVYAWNKGLEKILVQLCDRLRKIII